MYNYAPMIVICGLGVVVILGLDVGVLRKGSLEVGITRKVLGRLFFFYKSNQKVIDPIAQSIIGLC